jgi:hypothetical protein
MSRMRHGGHSPERADIVQQDVSVHNHHHSPRRHRARTGGDGVEEGVGGGEEGVPHRVPRRVGG